MDSISGGFPWFILLISLWQIGYYVYMYFTADPKCKIIFGEIKARDQKFQAIGTLGVRRNFMIIFFYSIQSKFKKDKWGLSERISGI